jgi:hypothetical protein
MSDFNLFDRTGDLRAAMLRLEYGCGATASELTDRIQAQERALPELRKFGRELDPRKYVAAREMVEAVAAGSTRSDQLLVLLIGLECDFVKIKARADRSRSNKRFDQFWEAFDALVRGRRCSGAKDAHVLTCARVPPPHAALSMARDRYRVLREEMGLT